MKTCRVLLNRGAAARAADELGREVIHVAAEAGNSPVLELVLSQSPDALEAEARGGIRPLHLCSLFGHTDSAHQLLLAGADVNAVDSRGMPALTYAARRGHLDVLNLLGENDAEVDHQDHRGDTPLHLAARGGHAKALKTLLAFAANPRLRNQAGKSPTDEAFDATDHSSREDMLAALQDYGATPRLPMKASESGEAPPVWTEFVDAATGATYVYNRITGESRWK